MAKLWRGVAWSALLLLSFGTTQAAQTVLLRGNRFEPASLDPHKYQTHYEANVALDLFEGLVVFDAQARPVPGVASGWSASADGRTWTFTLRANLTWSDGAPLNAQDAVFSFRRLMAPATAAQYAQLFYVIENGREVNTGALPPDRLGVSAPDAQTVVIKLTNPAPYLPELLANAFAAIVPRHAIESLGNDWVKPGKMVSNGAYQLVAWEPNSKIELQRNPNFHDVANVQIERVIFQPTADINSALSQFRAGQLDMQLEFPTAQIDALRANFPAETKIAPSLLTYYLALNTSAPPLTDSRVRRALSLAIDRDVLVARVTRLGESVAYSFVPPGTANYQPPVVADAALSSAQRLEQARALLTEAGYGPGKPLKVRYSFTSNDDVKRIGVAIAGMWKRAGVETELLNREGRVHFASLKQGDFQAGFVGWSADFNDASAFLYVLQSSSVNSNYSRYRNPAFDQLMVRAANERDAQARAKLLQDAEVMALADQPLIPLYTGVTRNLVAKHVRGWQANPLDFYPSRYLSMGPRAPQ